MKEPIELLKSWLNEAEDQVRGNWNAMCVSTIEKIMIVIREWFCLNNF